MTIESCLEAAGNSKETILTELEFRQLFSNMMYPLHARIEYFKTNREGRRKVMLKKRVI
jgi:hypothetical protein